MKCFLVFFLLGQTALALPFGPAIPSTSQRCVSAATQEDFLGSNAHLERVLETEIKAEKEGWTAESESAAYIDAYVELSKQDGLIRTEAEEIALRAELKHSELFESGIIYQAIVRVLGAQGNGSVEEIQTFFANFNTRPKHEQFSFTTNVVDYLVRRITPDLGAKEFGLSDEAAYARFLKEWADLKPTAYKAVEILVLTKLRAKPEKFVEEVTKARDGVLSRLFGSEETPLIVSREKGFKDGELAAYLRGAHDDFVNYFVLRNASALSEAQVRAISNTHGGQLEPMARDILDQRLFTLLANSLVRRTGAKQPAQAELRSLFEYFRATGHARFEAFVAEYYRALRASELRAIKDDPAFVKLSQATQAALEKRLAEKEIEANFDAISEGNRLALDQLLRGGRDGFGKKQLLELLDANKTAAAALLPHMTDPLLQIQLRLLTLYVEREATHHANKACTNCEVSGPDFELRRLVPMGDGIRDNYIELMRGTSAREELSIETIAKLEALVNFNAEKREAIASDSTEEFAVSTVINAYNHNIATARQIRDALTTERGRRLMSQFIAIQEMEVHRYTTGGYTVLTAKSTRIAFNMARKILTDIKSVL